MTGDQNSNLQSPISNKENLMMVLPITNLLFIALFCLFIGFMGGALLTNSR
jgi:cell division protein FtsX